VSNVNYGGQAVIEGVMMRGPQSWAVAVRRSDQTIALDLNPVNSVLDRAPFLKWPFLRGVVVLGESLVIGLKALTYSAGQAAGEEEEIKGWEMGLTLLAALTLAVLLFVVIPTGITHYAAAGIKGSLAQNVLEGILRLAVFLGYVLAIGRLPDIKRVFAYHGAEHKVINAYEAKEALTAENVQKYSTFHPRCGTSFILIVLVFSIFLFSLLPAGDLWWRVASRILILPVLAGLSYEMLKLSAKYPEFVFSRLFIIPGRWLQGLTTREPGDDQVEVAIRALTAVLQKEGEVKCSLS
jgi:Predicted metal-dependent enzyme